MTEFLLTVVILMAAALLAEVVAFVGMAVVAMRTARRAAAISEQLKLAVEPSIRLVNELKQTLQPRLETITNERQQIAELVSTRTDAVRAILDDTSRRAERVRLRLLEGVESVNGQPGRRGIYREIAEPIKTAGQVMRGLKIALWILRRVA
jgi:hypothetical protein